jgi:hypothetical protein
MRKHLFPITTALLGIAFAVGISFVTSTVPVVHAACQTSSTDSNKYCLLEPLPNGSSSFDTYSPATTAADYVNIIIKVFVSIIGALGVIMIVLGGIQYMTTDAVSKKEGGKEMITNSIFGLLLALASWLILNEINPHLTDIRIEPPKGVPFVATPGDTPGPSSTVSTTINGQQQSITTNCDQTSVDAAAADGVALSTGQPWGSVPAISNNDAEFRQRLAGVGVTVYNNDCSEVGSDSCTTVYKLGDTAISYLGNLRSSVCGTNTSCKLVLTGGTECWEHRTHQIGSGVVDLSPTPELVSFVTSHAPKVCGNWIGTSDGCPDGQAGFYTLSNIGLVFVKESNHYHVIPAH